ncbi:reticulophagy regulator 3-like [Harmonia axyridis]|uniref:reticulophagy regulator 3-like n=1 Tax=Harmonia axyridis TaxID=115357 RepID=UPI001E27796D|nr:reticulophagy regulator 3-like [Harmonia axyridis]
MGFILDILRSLRGDVKFSVKNEEINFFDDIFMVLSWDYPIYTLTAFVIVNYLFWIITYYELQTMCIIFTLLLFSFMYQSLIRFKKKTEFSSPKYEELYNTFCSFISHASLFRKENPQEFCVVVSFFFISLMYVASIFSGVFMSFFCLWSLFFVPLIYAHMPPRFQVKLQEVSAFLRRFQGTIEEEDLIPLPVEDENKGEDNEDLESLDTDRTADSVTNSLISGISSMPSFLDAEENHEILEEDLIPINPSHELSPSFAELSSDSESELHDIRFKETLSRESSSEEEGNFEEGLQFEDTQNQTQTDSKGLVHNILGYVASTGGFQIPNFLSNATTRVQSTETGDISIGSSTSEEDFEIIDVNELK